MSNESRANNIKKVDEEGFSEWFEGEEVYLSEGEGAEYGELRRLEGRIHEGTIKHGIDWTTIRRHYVVGKKQKLANGSWVSERISYTDLAQIYNISLHKVTKRSKQENWDLLRKSYLHQLEKERIGVDLGLYAQETYESEVFALNAATKLSHVVDAYIKYKYGKVLDKLERLNTDLSEDDLDEELVNELNEVNRNTGTPIFLDGVQRAAKILKDVYDLQRKVYDNAPKGVEMLEEVEDKSTKLSASERAKKIKELEAKLNIKLT